MTTITAVLACAWLSGLALALVHADESGAWDHAPPRRRLTILWRAVLWPVYFAAIFVAAIIINRKGI